MLCNKIIDFLLSYCVDKMWLSPVRHLPRIPSSYLDYSRHMPKKYVDRMKRTIPKKVFGGRCVTISYLLDSLSMGPSVLIS